MKRLFTLLSAAALACSAGTAFAGKDSGFYIGGSVGQADVEYSDDVPELGNVEFEIDDDDTAYKGFVGYNFGLVPFLDLAVEGSYIDFGSQNGEINNIKGANVDITGWSAAGLVGFNLGPVGVFGKAGLIAWDDDIDALSFDESDSGTDPMYGVGAKFQLGSFAIRAEYELFDLENGDIDYFSVGAAYTF
ncbi:outer membrane beta-barrel protein [Pseudomaricurvus sp.]|uniref:outer membrane beta-barrel protein n=1 Tax=Pseudomaricurvus sp. TaxID=2004510 RepID=UPI003F6D75FA